MELERLLADARRHGYVDAELIDRLSPCLDEGADGRSLLMHCPVVISGLSDTKLNGLHGIVVGKGREDRVAVRLNVDGRSMSVRMVKLGFPDPPPAFEEEPYITHVEKDDAMAIRLGEACFADEVPVEAPVEAPAAAPTEASAAAAAAVATTTAAATVAVTAAVTAEARLLPPHHRRAPLSQAGAETAELAEAEAVAEAEAASQALAAGGDGHDDEDGPSCRICMEDATEVRLLRPCACRGTQAWACKGCTVRSAVNVWQHNGDWSVCGACKQAFCNEVMVAIARERVAIVEAEIARLAAEPGTAEPDPRLPGLLNLLDVIQWEVVVTLTNYGRVLEMASRPQRKIYAEAERLGRERLLRVAEEEATAGGDATRVSRCIEKRLECLLLLGELCRYRRRLGEARRLITECLELTARPEVRGNRNVASYVADAKENLGNTLASMGRLEEAEATLREALALTVAQDGPGSNQATQGRACLATVLGRQRSAAKLQEAVVLAHSVATDRRRVLGAEDHKAIAAARYLARLEAKACEVALREGAMAMLGRKAAEAGVQDEEPPQVQVVT